MPEMPEISPFQSQESPPETTTIWERLRLQIQSQERQKDTRADREEHAQRLARRARILRRQPAESRQSASGTLYLAFDGGHGRYGIRITDVLEIQTLEHFTPVPHAPDFIAGVMLWQGSILTLLDIGKILGAADEGLPDYHCAIVVQAEGVEAAIMARDVEAVISAMAGEIRPAPQMPSQVLEDWIEGLLHDNRLILRLDRILDSIAAADGIMAPAAMK
jgi:purine-binding chemotaxis protein CheW